MLNTIPIWLSKIALEDDLAAAGFSRGKGCRGYTLDGLTFRLDDSWPILETGPQKTSTDPLLELASRPGFWKCVTKNGRVCARFDLPPSVICPPETGLEDPRGDGASPFLSMLKWALGTADGSVPTGWLAPECEDPMGMIPRNGLTVQIGVHARQGRPVMEPALFALQVPILSDLPEDLAERRKNWLRWILIEAQNRWRLVRIVFTGHGSVPRVYAEANLTGVPHSLLPELIPVALTALRSAVEWVIEPAVFLVSGPDDCRALETDPLRPDADRCPEKGGD